MIHIKPTQSVIKPTNKGLKIYKNDVVENCRRKEREIHIIKKYGSIKAYEDQKEPAEEYFKKLGWK